MSHKRISPSTAKHIMPAIYAGIFASLCWIVGDLLLVGFPLTPEKYPLFSQTYASKVDINFATLMLSASTKRLMWGALIAFFSVPFYLYSISAASHVLKRRFMLPVFLLLMFGFAYDPLGHAAFFYVGEIYKAILASDASAHALLLETGASFMTVLKITWITSLAFTCIAWLVFGIFVATDRALLKRKDFWINPLSFIIAIMLISQILPSPVKDWIACAMFNEAHFIFFIILLIKIKKEVKASSSPKEEK